MNKYRFLSGLVQSAGVAIRSANGSGRALRQMEQYTRTQLRRWCAECAARGNSVCSLCYQEKPQDLMERNNPHGIRCRECAAQLQTKVRHYAPLRHTELQDRILQTHLRNPQMTHEQVAQECGTTQSYTSLVIRKATRNRAQR